MLEKFISFISGKLFLSRFSVTLWKAKWLPSSFSGIQSTKVFCAQFSGTNATERNHQKLQNLASSFLSSKTRHARYFGSNNSLKLGQGNLIFLILCLNLSKHSFWLHGRIPKMRRFQFWNRTERLFQQQNTFQSINQLFHMYLKLVWNDLAS